MHALRPNFRRGFTILEIMIVISIMAVVMAVAVPAIIRSSRKQPLAAALDTVSGLCARARAESILKRQRRQLQFELMGRPRQVVLLGPSAGQSQAGAGVPLTVSAAPVELARAILPDFVEISPADSFATTFRPDGTCDGFKLEFRGDGHSYTMELEPATSLALIKENF